MKALVIGGARSGSAVSLLLNKQGYDVTLVSRDPFDTMDLLMEKGIEVILDDQETDIYDDYDIVVKNPGIPNTHPLVKRFNRVLNEIDIASQLNPSGTYYAISGTNGKTTTTHLLHQMLLKKDKNALLAGNIGVPLSQKIYEQGDMKRDVALEIAAFQIEGTPHFKPKVFSLLNLTPDHLDRYDSAEDYYQAKLKLVQNAKIFLRNFDDPNSMRYTKKTMPNVLDVSIKEKKDIYIHNEVAYFKDTVLFHVKDLKLQGEHNLSNALFASAMAFIAGVDPKDITDVLNEFGGVEHRLEFVRNYKGVAYYNDSKATNPESCEKALLSFKEPVILLAGGKDEKIAFDLLAQYASKCKAVYLFGESKYLLKEVFPNAILTDTLEMAFKAASESAKAADVVLLSPACASYDQFKNFEERGKLFKSLVMKL